MTPLRLLLFLSSVSKIHSLELRMSTDGPAVLDAPLSVSGKLHGLEYDEDDLKWHWYDDSGSDLHSWVVITPGNQSQLTYTLRYESFNFEARKYRMDLRVFRRDIFGFWSILVESFISFSITEELNGQILVPKDILSTQIPLNVSLSFHDPHAFIRNASEVKYFWSINDTNYGPTSEPFKIFHMHTLGFAHFVVLTVASFPTNNLTKYGNFSKDIIVRDPINFVNATGDLWLKHNQILDLNMKCDGSGPWGYCWSVQSPDYNVTGNETCIQTTELQNDCAFEVYWYFRKSGSHKILVIVDNGVSQVIKLYEVTVYKIKPQTPVSFVVVPIVSVIGIIFIFIIALLLVVKFKRRLAIETADFDFSIQDDHNLEYRTFWERLRDSMLNAFGNTSDDVSHISSSNSSSHGGSVKPPVGIHYGSIS